ncbi:hypothetical protein D3C80_1369620 [compost metagenome]
MSGAQISAEYHIGRKPAVLLYPGHHQRCVFGPRRCFDFINRLFNARNLVCLLAQIVDPRGGRRAGGCGTHQAHFRLDAIQCGCTFNDGLRTFKYVLIDGFTFAACFDF